MKKLYSSLICTAALVAAMGIAGCSESDGGKHTTQRNSEIMQQLIDNATRNKDCPEDGKCETEQEENLDVQVENGDSGDCKDDCPEKDEKCPDGKCPKEGKNRAKGRHRAVFPRGRFNGDRRNPKHPKLPVEPPHDDDIILPDPPVEEEPQN